MLLVRSVTWLCLDRSIGINRLLIGGWQYRFSGPCDPGKPLARQEGEGGGPDSQGRMNQKNSLFHQAEDKVNAPACKFGDLATFRLALTMHQAALPISVFGHRLGNA